MSQATIERARLEHDGPRSAAPFSAVLIMVIAVAALVVAGTAGWLVRGGGGGGSTAAVVSSTPSDNSVDAGFARDMSTHHTQAVTMAGYARDTTTDKAIKNLAFDIETTQNQQVGRMMGWLDTWGLSPNSTDPMSWMGSAHMTMGPNGLMPGMATPAQMTKLETMRGKALDVRFLQLMIHHHQGGVTMARYAMQHATEPYVRVLAASMVSSQTSEIRTMLQMLAALGAKALPPPS